MAANFAWLICVHETSRRTGTGRDGTVVQGQVRLVAQVTATASDMHWVSLGKEEKICSA